MSQYSSLFILLHKSDNIIVLLIHENDIPELVFGLVKFSLHAFNLDINIYTERNLVSFVYIRKILI